MYLIFRCDCGRVLYAKKGVATRKCVCGKSIKVKIRRIFRKVETAEEASDAVREMQEEIYGGTGFQTADKL
jgi:transcription elongation factor Elf1